MDRLIRTYPGTGKFRPVVEVLDVADIVEEGVKQSSEAKNSTHIWDESKVEFRRVAHDAAQQTELAFQQPLVRLLGKKEKHVIEVEPSRKRKSLPTYTAGKLLTSGLGHLVQEEVTVTLKGELAAWALTVFKDREGKDANLDVSRRTVLTPLFEEEIATANGHKDLLLEAYETGIYAAAVEAKLK